MFYLLVCKKTVGFRHVTIVSIWFSDRGAEICQLSMEPHDCSHPGVQAQSGRRNGNRMRAMWPSFGALRDPIVCCYGRKAFFIAACLSTGRADY